MLKIWENIITFPINVKTEWGSHTCTPISSDWFQNIRYYTTHPLLLHLFVLLLDLVLAFLVQIKEQCTISEIYRLCISLSSLVNIFFSSIYVCIQVCVLFSLSGIQLWAYGKAIHEEFTGNWRHPIVNCYGEHFTWKSGTQCQLKNYIEHKSKSLTYIVLTFFFTVP